MAKKNTNIISKNLKERLYKAIQPGYYPQDKEDLKILTKNVLKGHDRFNTEEWLKKYSALSKELQEADKNNNFELVSKIRKKMDLLDKEPTIDDPYSEAGWKKYLNLDTEQDTVFTKAKYIPKNSINKKNIYYSLPKEFGNDLVNTLAPVDNFPKNKRADEFMFSGSFGENQSKARVLGNFKVDKGNDERGKYISYYDKYDLNPEFPGLGNTNIDFIGDPFEIYGRQYYEANSPNLNYPKAIEPRHAGNFIPNTKQNVPDFNTKFYATGGEMKKNTNKQFNPSYISGIPMYGFGSWLKDNVVPIIGDAGKLMADNAMSVFGATDVIKDNSYSTNAFKKLSGVTNQINKIGGMAAASIVAPGVGGQLMGGVQRGLGSVAGDESKQSNIQQTKSTQEQQQQLNNQQLLNSLQTQPQYSYANGGMLNSYAGGGNITGRITSVDNGGLHSENGGVKLGPSAMIERDEVVFKTKGGKKYIFTNRF